MLDNDILFPGVGNNAKVDHVAIQTAFGMMIAATTLFKKLGYSVHPERKAEGEWGKAIFLVKEGSLSIQLTDSADDTPIPASENHVGIAVFSPRLVAENVQAWALYGGVSAEVEEVPGGKYFVTLPEILTVPLELVPLT